MKGTSMQKVIIAILIILFTGCKSEVPKSKKFEISDLQKKETEEVALKYARDVLKVDEEVLGRVVSKFYCREKDGRKIASIDFFDEKVFPEDQRQAMMGGFPHYFTIDIDISDMTVVKHYASPM